jgi:pimeloyl-ACP methyl ester carboxylesterase
MAISCEERSVQVDLVNTTASDGVRLDGAIWAAAFDGPQCEFDAVMCLHGVGGNFYGSRLFDALTEPLRARGISVLRVNTRGHDGVSTASTPHGGRLQGAAYERVSDCCLDVAAWADFLVAANLPRIAIIGHSLGALKAIYAQAYAPHEAVRRIVAISPPRLSYTKFVHGTDAQRFRSSLEMAEQLVREGQPQMLFLASFPFPLILAAATFLDKYGIEERYNLLKFSERLATPTWFVYGAEELASGGSAFDGVTQEIESAAWGSRTPSVHVIPDANHFYVGSLNELSHVVLGALQ